MFVDALQIRFNGRYINKLVYGYFAVHQFVYWWCSEISLCQGRIIPKCFSASSIAFSFSSGHCGTLPLSDLGAL